MYRPYRLPIQTAQCTYALSGQDREQGKNNIEYRYLDLKWHFMCAQENSREYNYNPYLYTLCFVDANALHSVTLFFIPGLHTICAFFYELYILFFLYIYVKVCAQYVVSFGFAFDFWPLSYISIIRLFFSVNFDQSDLVWCGVVVHVAPKFIIINTTSGPYIKCISYACAVFFSCHIQRRRLRRHYYGQVVRSYNLQRLVVLDN